MAPMHFRPRSTAAPSDVKKMGRPRNSLTERKLQQARAIRRPSAPKRTMGDDNTNNGETSPSGVPHDLLRGPPRVSTSPRSAPGQEHGGVVSESLFTSQPLAVGPVTLEDGLVRALKSSPATG